MSGSRYALAVLVSSLAALAAGQSLAPEAGLLVLKNGQVIEGDVTRAGDYFVVTRGEGTELRLKADDVECFCASLEEAYEFKARRLTGQSFRGRLDLARWCLRNGLLDHCHEQILQVDRAEPNNAQVKELMTRLEVMQLSPPAPSGPAATLPVPPEKLEQTIAELPRGSVERFGAIVQPILLNRCAANQCHGPNSKSEFRLLRPPPGQTVSRRFTQRNLATTLRQLDRSSPDQSPLVLKAEQRHGSALTPVFDKHSANQLSEIVGWARMTSGPNVVPAAGTRSETATYYRPASITPAASTLSQPAAPGTDGSPAAAPVQPTRPTTTENTARTAQPPPSKNAEPAGQPRDRYDPEIFNRRYLR